MRTIASTLLGLTLCAASSAASAGMMTLYDGAVNTAPEQQGWFYRYLPLLPPVIPTVAGGLATLDTTGGNGIQAGWFTTDPLAPASVHPDMPVLDRNAGYTVRFDLRVESEMHARPDRAGISLIALGSDRKGVELGFWTDEVWAQSDDPLFTHAEGVAFATTSLIRYELSVLGAAYTLYADGSPILAGSLRDYSVFGPPYSTANQLFIGDDTTSARARFDLAYVAVGLAPVSVPEPSTLTLLVLSGFAGLAWRGRPGGSGSIARRSRNWPRAQSRWTPGSRHGQSMS